MIKHSEKKSNDKRKASIRQSATDAFAYTRRECEPFPLLRCLAFSPQRPVEKLTHLIPYSVPLPVLAGKAVFQAGQQH
jgi:hypothetical protein